MLVLLLTALVLLVCLALLSSLCLHCYKRPMVSIRQTRTSEDTYIPSSQFLMNRPMQYSVHQNYVHPPSNLLSPHFSGEGSQRPARPSVTPTETESNNSYENTGPCADSEEEVPDPGYIVVLPETAPPVAKINRTSTTSSESVGSDEDAEPNYVNLGDPESSFVSPHDQLDINESQDSSEHSDSDEEGDYVNQPSFQKSEAEPSA
ncbi:linker for activation of T-cells family member 1-like isoform X1 [Periophthalmus magnuspinnatus]|uniref:linker for activation of T-cells family member 1-like isoform X1 n=1 Tax=Periophthalmus magnuspinnatus TaxID=409849 RepID=UPI00145BE1A5|nr:linker for activation of T-cells family member 1-like isoform X1 [Periophthalmus magnuspinnatus]